MGVEAVGTGKSEVFVIGGGRSLGSFAGDERIAGRCGIGAKGVEFRRDGLGAIGDVGDIFEGGETKGDGVTGNGKCGCLGVDRRVKEQKSGREQEWKIY